MVLNGVTDGKNDVVPVGIDFRTGDVSGNLIITKSNNNDVVQGPINKNFVDSSKTMIEYFSITEDKIYIYFDSWNQLSNKVMMNRFNRH